MASEQPIPMGGIDEDIWSRHPLSSFMKEKNVGGAIKDKISLAMNGLYTPSVAPGDAMGNPAPTTPTAQAINPLYEAVHPNTLDRVLNFAKDFGSMFLPGTAEASEVKPGTPVPLWSGSAGTFPPKSVSQSDGMSEDYAFNRGYLPPPSRAGSLRIGQFGPEENIDRPSETPEIMPWISRTAGNLTKDPFTGKSPFVAPIDMTRDPATGGYVAPPYTGPAPWRRGVPNEINTPDPNAMAIPEAPIPMGWKHYGESDSGINYKMGETGTPVTGPVPIQSPEQQEIAARTRWETPGYAEAHPNLTPGYQRSYYDAHPEEGAAATTYDLVRPPGENSYEGAVNRMKQQTLQEIANNRMWGTPEGRKAAGEQALAMEEGRKAREVAAQGVAGHAFQYAGEQNPNAPLSQERIARANYYQDMPNVRRDAVEERAQTAREKIEAGKRPYPLPGGYWDPSKNEFVPQEKTTVEQRFQQHILPGLQHIYSTAMTPQAGDVMAKAYIDQARKQFGMAPLEQETPPVEGARKAPDGKWYVPDPKRKGKYLMVQ